MCKLKTIITNYGEELQVAEIKSRYIENIIGAAGVCPYIEKIYVFGSSVEERCTDSSDIDIAVISNTTRSRLFSNPEYKRFRQMVFLEDPYQQYDILQFQDGEERKHGTVSREILNNGRLIYKRGVVNV